jgi:hypothetical protein
LAGAPPGGAPTAELVGFSTEPRPPLELIHVPPNPQGLCPPEYRDRLLVHTVHDGTMIPDFVLDSEGVRELERDGRLWWHYIRERDWGANMVAEELAHALGLEGYWRVNIARAVLDFNRFPGESPPDGSALDRMAILHPFSQRLSHQHKRRLLEHYYDAISELMERALADKLITLAIHTYDRHNATETQRPEVSLLTRALSYQQGSRLPYNTFDPLFPDVLAESSANRVLRDRVALTVEKAGLDVEHNYPYCLPDGSLEVRSQPWLFFREVRRQLLRERPSVEHNPAFSRVFEMLLNTNLRLADAEALAGYLRRFRRAPAGREEDFEAAARAYDELRDFLAARPSFVEDYRRSPDRTSALGVEVRKDLVWEFEDHQPVLARPAQARTIAQTIALGIAEYLQRDR